MDNANLIVLGLCFSVIFIGLAACRLPNTRVVVEWTTASEINTSGFNLYRSERTDGPYVKINAQLIPASTDPLVGGKYRYQDTNVESGRTYYYQLEDVELDGSSARHGPIVVTASVWAVDRPTSFLAIGLLALVAMGGGIYLARRHPET
jgi:hypothetical protein